MDAQHRAAEMALLAAAGVVIQKFFLKSRFSGNPHNQCVWARIDGGHHLHQIDFAQRTPAEPVCRLAEILCFISAAMKLEAVYWTMAVDNGLVKVYGMPETLSWETFAGVPE